MLSRLRLFATLWTVAHQAPLSMGFSRQEYWSGLPFPSPGDLPDPGTKPRSPALRADALTSEPPRKPPKTDVYIVLKKVFFFKIYIYLFGCLLGFPVAQWVKCLPTMWETSVRSLCQEDPLEKAMAPRSSTLAWKIPWMEEPGRL